MTTPDFQQNDLIYCTVNMQIGWCRIQELDDQGNVLLCQFQQSGSRTSVGVSNPTVSNPQLFIRADYSADIIYTALVKLLGVAGAAFVSK